MNMTKAGGAKAPRVRVAKAAPPKNIVATRDVIAAAAAGIGGTERLIAWIQADPKNEATFWSSIYPKLISVQLSGEDKGPVAHKLIVQFLD